MCSPCACSACASVRNGNPTRAHAPDSCSLPPHTSAPLAATCYDCVDALLHNDRYIHSLTHDHLYATLLTVFTVVDNCLTAHHSPTAAQFVTLVRIGRVCLNVSLCRDTLVEVVREFAEPNAASPSLAVTGSNKQSVLVSLHTCAISAHFSVNDASVTSDERSVRRANTNRCRRRTRRRRPTTSLVRLILCICDLQYRFIATGLAHSTTRVRQLARTGVHRACRTMATIACQRAIDTTLAFLHARMCWQ